MHEYRLILLSVVMKTLNELGWTTSKIKEALEDEGWSCRQLSFSRGYTSNALQTALHRPYPQAERIIADVIGVRASEIWPDRYDDKGNPNRGKPARTAVKGITK